MSGSRCPRALAGVERGCLEFLGYWIRTDILARIICGCARVSNEWSVISAQWSDKDRRQAQE